ncbi:AI-2E family transporter [Agaribacterium sp. ZY112]|uniref:AI-2E family transporter n=1 Tax=Agaribacterium sp. ZY112 TaxID=3233574 RepID=UPI00352425C3
MSSSTRSTKHLVEPIVQIAILGLLLFWCFKIVAPFIQPVLWGMIIAVATFPLYKMLQKRLGKRQKLAAPIFTLIMLGLLITPTYHIAASITSSAAELTEKWKTGNLSIAPPAEKVKSWPVVGEKLYDLGLSASQNLEATIAKHQEPIAKMGKAAFSAIAGAGFGVLQFVISIIVAGVLLANAASCSRFADALAFKLAGKVGEDFATQAGKTIASVAKGVLGVAIIQAILAAVGLLLLGVPGAGIWAVVVLVLAIMQLPPILILGPIAAWAFSAYDSTPAALFLVWSIIVSVSDGFLKPLLLGRGLSTPMMVILIGAIGGMMLSGIIGLFVGAVVLALAYELFVSWLFGHPSEQADQEQLQAPESKQASEA